MGGEDQINQDDGIFQAISRSGKWSRFEDIPVHGDAVVGKPDNCFRIYFENVDGFVAPTTQTRTFRTLNNKQTYLTHLVRRL